MLEELGIVASGVALGLSLAAPPGPVNALIAVQSMTRSPVNGFLVGFGALTADAIFLIATYYLGGLLLVGDTVSGMLSVISCCLMAYFAYKTFKSPKSIEAMAARTPERAQRPYFTGLSMGITNPFQMSWWVTVGLSLIASIGILIIIGFFAGIIFWITLFPASIHWLSKRVSFLYRFVVFASALLLAAFSAWFLYNAVMTLSQFI